MKVHKKTGERNSNDRLIISKHEKYPLFVPPWVKQASSLAGTTQARRLLYPRLYSDQPL
jgi:hypothetical protein